MTWNLRYAAHLGFRSPEAPLFPASAGSSDPLAQIDFAASIGFAGVQDPWFTSRPPSMQGALAARVRERGLEAGCIACGNPSTIRAAPWTRVDGASRANLERELSAAIVAARRLGSRQIIVLIGADADTPRQMQIDRVISNLAWATQRLADEGLVLCLEPINARAIPGMLMNHFPEGCDIAGAVGHPGVRMVFDTAHVQSMDGDVLTNLERGFDLIEVVQIANHPGRTEPEIGEIDVARVLTRVYQLGYRGMVELEHAWSKPGQDAERRALDWLRRADATLTSVQTREEPIRAERQGGEGGRDRAADVAISGPPGGTEKMRNAH